MSIVMTIRQTGRAKGYVIHAAAIYTAEETKDGRLTWRLRQTLDGSDVLPPLTRTCLSAKFKREVQERAEQLGIPYMPNVRQNDMVTCDQLRALVMHAKKQKEAS